MYIMSYIELGEGTISQVSAFLRKIVEEALKPKAASIILARYHPGGMARPSKHGESINTEIKRALARVEISLINFIVLTNNEYYSVNRNFLI